MYGLGCDCTNKGAIERLYQIKGIKKDHPLAFVCPDLGEIARYAVVENATYRVLKHFLPGPYTFVLQATREVPKMLQSKTKTVGIRVPDNAVACAIVRELGRPILSTTAQMPGGAPFIDPYEIRDAFPTLDLITDAGTGGEVPTTVVDLSSGKVVVVREGAGPIDELVA